MKEKGEDVGNSFLSVLRLMSLVTIPIGLLLSGAADPFIEAVLGDKWQAMTGVVAILGIWGAIRPLQTTVGWLLNSLGHAGLMGMITAAALVPLVPGLLIAASQSGLAAVAWVMLVDLLLSLAAHVYFVSRRCGIGLNRQWVAIRPAVLAAAPMWIAARVTGDVTESIAPILSLAASAGCGLAVFVLTVTLFDRSAMRIAIAQVGQTLRAGPAAVSEA
jgi:PST family polysaccharide transporter